MGARGIVDGVICRADGVWPKVGGDCVWPSVGGMDDRCPCEVLECADVAFGSTVLVVPADSCKGETLVGVKAGIFPRLGAEYAVVGVIVLDVDSEGVRVGFESEFGFLEVWSVLSAEHVCVAEVRCVVNEHTGMPVACDGCDCAASSGLSKEPSCASPFFATGG